MGGRTLSARPRAKAPEPEIAEAKPVAKASGQNLQDHLLNPLRKKKEPGTMFLVTGRK